MGVACYRLGDGSNGALEVVFINVRELIECPREMYEI